MKKQLDANALAGIYNDIAFIEENIKTISNLSQQLIEDDANIIIGIKMLGDEVVQPQQPAIAIPILGLVFQPPPQQSSPDYEWVVDESTTLRILAVLHDYLTNEIKYLKKQL